MYQYTAIFISSGREYEGSSPSQTLHAARPLRIAVENKGFNLRVEGAEQREEDDSLIQETS